MKYGYVTNNNKYDFFYDESNNIRVFSLRDNKYNTDSNPQVIYSPIFVIGGLVAMENERDETINEIVNKIAQQKNMKEIKLKHLAKGDFLDILNSKKVEDFLSWLLDSKYYMHYFAINTVYWSFLDIIEDSVSFLLEKNDAGYILNDCKSEDEVRARIDYFKNCLYTLIKIDKQEFIEYIKTFSYPKILNTDAARFYRGLHKLSRKNLNSNRSSSNKLHKYIDRQLIDLTRFLAKCKDAHSIELTFDDEIDTLIGSFSSFYMSRMMGFLNSNHFLDKEDTIEPIIESLVKHQPPNDDVNPFENLKYQFVESTTALEIQLSDVVSGIIRLLYSFIEDSDQDDVEKFILNANNQQRKNLELIYNNILKAEKECEGFIFRVQVPGDEYKMDILFKGIS